MKQLTCEMCGSTDLMKQDGVFVCQSCGTKYSVEEAKKMMVEGTVDVSGSTVKVDTSGELANLYQIARRAKDDNNGENAAKYYDMVLMKDPTSWEASFYVVYFKAMECKIAQIQSAGISVANCIDTVLKLIKDNVANRQEQKAAYTEVANRVMIISGMLFNGAKNHYDGIDAQIKSNYTQEWLNNGFAAMQCAYTLGDNLDLLFGADTEANQLSVSAWRQGVAWHQSLMGNLADKDSNRNVVNGYVSKAYKIIKDQSGKEISRTLISSDTYRQTSKIITVGTKKVENTVVNPSEPNKNTETPIDNSENTNNNIEDNSSEWPTGWDTPENPYYTGNN